jgi:autotransporter-associated beta strand protein
MQGLGKLLLTGDSTFSGATTVSGGSLLVGNGVSGSLNGTISVVVFPGATLGGSGSITTSGGGISLFGGAFLAPGNSAGTLTLNTGASPFDISGAASSTASFLYALGAVSDRFVLTAGTLTICAGMLDLDDFVFSNSGGFGPGSYTLFDTSSAIVEPLGPNVSGTVLGFPATLAFGDGNRDIVLVVVPEPASVAVLLASAGVLASFRRRRPAQTSRA